MKPEKLNITIIGAGKIAYSLAGALIEKNIVVSSVISRNISSARNFADIFNIPSFSDKLELLNPKSNLIILSVPDKELSGISKYIARLGINFKNKTFIHLSGSLSIDVLKPLAAKGAKTASFHIMQTFPFKKQIPIKGCFSAIETDDKAVGNTLQLLSKKLELIPFAISSEAKTNYHIASVFACNFLAGNFFSSDYKITLTGIKPEAIELFEPILLTTLKNIKENGAVKALSGPVERNDTETIKRHISALRKKKGKNNSDSIEKFIYLSYLAQSLILTEMASKKKEEEWKGAELKNWLVDELKNIVNLL